MTFATNVQIAISSDQIVWVACLMAAFFVLSFFFSGTETALFSMQKVDRLRLRRGTRTDAQTAMLLEKKSPLITTILIGNETVNIGLAALGAALVGSLQPDRPWLNILLLTPALVLFSEITPKILAFRFNMKWAAIATWPLWAFGIAVTPIRILVVAIVRACGKLFRVTESEADDRLGEDEILDIIEESAAAGGVDDRERDIVEAVFEFDDLTVGRVMTPRPRMFSLPLNISWKQLMNESDKAGFSRVPIYGRLQDDIVGVLLLKDLLGYSASPPNPARELKSLLMNAVFVPQSKPVPDMLREFLDRKNHLALVVDEHGTLVGLVTLDDLLAELLDHESEANPDIERERPGELTVNAAMDIEDFHEQTGIVIPTGEYHTVGGFVFHQLGRLPQSQDSVEAGTHTYTVLKMNGRSIDTLQVKPLSQPARKSAP